MGADDEQRIGVRLGQVQHPVQPGEHVGEGHVRVRLGGVEDHVSKDRRHLAELDGAGHDDFSYDPVGHSAGSLTPRLIIAGKRAQGEGGGGIKNTITLGILKKKEYSRIHIDRQGTGVDLEKTPGE